MVRRLFEVIVAICVHVCIYLILFYVYGALPILRLLSLFITVKFSVVSFFLQSIFSLFRNSIIVCLFDSIEYTFMSPSFSICFALSSTRFSQFFCHFLSVPNFQGLFCIPSFFLLIFHRMSFWVFFFFFFLESGTGPPPVTKGSLSPCHCYSEEACF